MSHEFSPTALELFNDRYYVRSEQGHRLERCPEQVFQRVADALSKDDYQHALFYDIMSSGKFLPAGRTLANAGGPTKLVANCVVLEIKDSLTGPRSIFGTLSDAVALQQAGSGIGFNFSTLRPRNSLAIASRGSSSGPVSFLEVYDRAFAVIKQQGRHGANMATFDLMHPDVIEFIDCKRDSGRITNFNTSVLATDTFMRQASMISDRNRPKWVAMWDTTVTECSYTSADLLDRIAKNAWSTGEPGMVFIDTVNRNSNPLPGLGPIRATNPCGEMPLHAGDCCNLGSINLSKFVDSDTLETKWEELAACTSTAVDLLDSVVDHLNFPVDFVTQTVRANRRVGLGVMGFAEYLMKKHIPYSSDRCAFEAERVMAHIQRCAHRRSEIMAAAQGPFPNWNHVLDLSKSPRRNATLTTVPPTGTTSMLLGVTGGIEPAFRLAYNRDISGKRVPVVNSVVLDELDRCEDISEGERRKFKCRIKTTGHLCNNRFPYLETADEISPHQHIAVQAAFQRHVDASISKTVNMPNSATVGDVKEAFKFAWQCGCAGITVYRDGSRDKQVLYEGVCETCDL